MMGTEKRQWLTAEDMIDTSAAPRKFPKRSFRGELEDSDGLYVGSLYFHEGRVFIGQTREFSSTRDLVKMLPGSFHPKSFFLHHKERISQKCQIRRYRFTATPATK